MLSFSGFRLEDGSPIYQQIIRYLEQGIAAGTIRDGDGLPSRRVLSAQLGSTPTPCRRPAVCWRRRGSSPPARGPRANLPWTRRLWPPSAPA
ncbi:GntR family transcriptional regulator [Flavonifractor plautii]|nr:GntR family transcriptional regulator [Flavonifractor plautii]